MHTLSDQPRTALVTRPHRTSRLRLLCAAALTAGILASYAGDPEAKGDVIYNGGFGHVTGHVGIWDGSRVLEVGPGQGGLKRSCIYNNQTLASFKRNFPYGGARYDSKLSRSKLQQVLDVGRQQAEFRPKYAVASVWDLSFRRSASTAWVLGRSGNRVTLVKKQAPIDSYLRCDFFVMGAFTEGAGKKFKLPLLMPDVVFKAFDSAR